MPSRTQVRVDDRTTAGHIYPDGMLPAMSETENTKEAVVASIVPTTLPAQDLDAVFGLLARMTQEFARGVDLEASLEQALHARRERPLR